MYPADNMEEQRERRWFGKPLRDISIHCNPRKITLAEFVKDVANGVEVFGTNMNHLGHLQNEEYIETFMKTFLEWFELEQE